MDAFESYALLIKSTRLSLFSCWNLVLVSVGTAKFFLGGLNFRFPLDSVCSFSLGMFLIWLSSLLRPLASLDFCFRRSSTLPFHPPCVPFWLSSTPEASLHEVSGAHSRLAVARLCEDDLEAVLPDPPIVAVPLRLQIHGHDNGHAPKPYPVRIHAGRASTYLLPLCKPLRFLRCVPELTPHVPNDCERMFGHT